MKNRIVRSVVGIFIIAACVGGLEIWAPSAGAAGQADRKQTIEGRLEVIADCGEKVGKTLYFLDTGSERLSVTFNEAPPIELLTDMRVMMRGSRKGGAEFAADECWRTEATEQGETILPNTFGGIKVLVLLVNFQNDLRTPYTAAQAREVMFSETNSSSVRNYYREASYGKTWVKGDVRGWYTLPMNADCDANAQIATLGKQAAAAAGVNLSAYRKFMFVFPNIGCTYGGRGLIGGQDTWINGSLFLRTMAHELGHNLGLYHSKAMDCGDTVITAPCTIVEYGHPTDMLGQSPVTGHFHPYQKERLGWLNYVGAAPVTTVTTNGNYLITAGSVADGQSKGLKIWKSTDAQGRKTWYYVEVRRPVGFDAFVSNNSSIMNGVLVSMNNEMVGSENYALDMTPTTPGFADAALAVGQSYTDPAARVTIRPTSVGAAGAMVNVTFN